ncbi:hypothetical protein [Aquimarina sp. I32.4]|uniref:hypothetical protein n=1 Tax=Aquimarina sp. I32.4 TaxID=2053903 RepID=UPI000CDE6AD5|nr:hypothetical protein [Aquimarina sp. I32.4]
MKPQKVYYLGDGSRMTFIILGIVVVCAALFFLKWSFDEIEFKFELGNLLTIAGALLCLNLAYKGIKKLYNMIRYNIPIIELYDTFMVVALYPGGKYTFAYKALFGKFSYSKIDFENIESVYRNKKLIRMDYSRVQGYTFITGTIDDKKYDIPTIIGAIGSSSYLNLKIRLNQENFDVSKMI